MPTRFIAKGYGLEPGKFSDVAPIGVNSTTNRLEFSPNGTTVQLHDSANPSLAADGSASAPSYSFASAATSGMYWTGTSLGFSRGGTQQAQFPGSGMFDLVQDTAAIRMGASADVSLSRGGAANLRLGSNTTAQRFDVANTYTSATNNELFSIDWQTVANTAIVGTRTATTGTTRDLRLVAQLGTGTDGYGAIQISRLGAPFFRAGFVTAAGSWAQTTGGTGNIFQFSDFTSSTTSGSVAAFAITPTYNQTSGTAANTDLLINRTQTAVGSGGQYLIDAQVGGSTRFNVTAGGSVFANGNVLTNGYVSLGGNSNTTIGDATSSVKKIKQILSIANAVATDVFTVTVPNASNMATIRVTLSASLGAGGAIGAGEATGNISYDFAVTRTAGVATVATASSAYGSSTAAVAGAATITVTADASAMSGAVGATQTFTIQVTVSRGSGASTNHTVRATVEIINANASGITVT